MSEATDKRNQWRETTHAAQTASLIPEGVPHYAVRRRLIAVANELREAAETAEGAREGLLKLALRFEQHALGDNQ